MEKISRTKSKLNYGTIFRQGVNTDQAINEARENQQAGGGAAAVVSSRGGDQ